MYESSFKSVKNDDKQWQFQMFFDDMKSHITAQCTYLTKTEYIHI